MKKGAIEFEKIVGMILILMVLILLIVFIKTKFDVIKEAILGLKVR